MVAVDTVRLGKLAAADFKAVCGSLTELFNREFNRKALSQVPLFLEHLKREEMDLILTELSERQVASPPPPYPTHDRRPSLTYV